MSNDETQFKKAVKAYVECDNDIQDLNTKKKELNDEKKQLEDNCNNDKHIFNNSAGPWPSV